MAGILLPLHSVHRIQGRYARLSVGDSAFHSDHFTAILVKPIKLFQGVFWLLIVSFMVVLKAETWDFMKNSPNYIGVLNKAFPSDN